MASDSKKTRASKSAAARAAAATRARAIKEKAANGGNPASGFVDFIRQQGVVGLAIGLVLGIQVKALVDQIVASFMDPLIGLVMPGKGDLDAKTFSLSFGDQTAVFSYGAFISVLISFLVVALVVYLTFKILRLDKLDKKNG